MISNDFFGILLIIGGLWYLYLLFKGDEAMVLPLIALFIFILALPALAILVGIVMIFK